LNPVIRSPDHWNAEAKIVTAEDRKAKAHNKKLATLSADVFREGSLWWGIGPWLGSSRECVKSFEQMGRGAGVPYERSFVERVNFCLLKVSWLVVVVIEDVFDVPKKK
jgi:hypothetical protein